MMPDKRRKYPVGKVQGQIGNLQRREKEEEANFESKYLLRSILVQQPVRFKLGGRPVLSAHLNVETAGSEPKRPEF